MTEVEAEGLAAGAGTARTLVRAGLIVTGAFLASRILGWVRVVVLGATFGASRPLDEYYAAFRIPDFVFQLVAAGALGAAVIPVLSGLFAHGEDARAWRVLGTVTNLMFGALLVLAVVVFALAPWLVPLVTPGFTPSELDRTVELTRLMLLSPIFLTVGAIASSALNALGLFAAAALAPLLYNLAIIGAAIFLAPLMGVEALAVGVVIGALLNALVQLPQLVRRSGFAFHLGIDLRDPAAREALLLLVPRALGLSVTQITFVVNTSLATGLGAGLVSVYNMAFTVMQIPLGVIGLPLGVVLLPSLSRAAALGATRDFATLTVRSIRLLLYVMLFLTATALVLRREAVTVLFQYARFSLEDVRLTADALFVFLLGLAGSALIVILARAFYAAKDTRTPVLAAVLSVIVNVVISIATVGSLGLAGLALGIAAGEWFEAVLLLLVLERRLPGLDLPALARAGTLFAGGAAVAGLVAAGVQRVLLDRFGEFPGKPLLIVEAGLAFAAAGLAYLAFSRLLRIPEAQATFDLLRAALRRTGPGA